MKFIHTCSSKKSMRLFNLNLKPFVFNDACNNSKLSGSYIRILLCKSVSILRSCWKACLMSSESCDGVLGSSNSISAPIIEFRLSQLVSLKNKMYIQ